MGFLLHLTDTKGNFELIDEDLLYLYNLNKEDLIPISEDQYSEFCTKDNGKTLFINGEFIFQAITTNDIKSLVQRKDYLLQKLVLKTDLLESKTLDGYSKAEVASFYKQEAEARAWLKDKETPTPMLSEIVEKREEILDLATLVNKIIFKADAYSALMGSIIGKKQSIETKIEKATNLEDLESFDEIIDKWSLLDHQ